MTELREVVKIVRNQSLTVELPRYVWGFVEDAVKAGASRERHRPTGDGTAVEDALARAAMEISDALDRS